MEIQALGVYQHLLTNLNKAIVCRSFLPFKMCWLHLSGFVVKLTNEFCIVTIGMNVKRLATVISEAFKMTFTLVENSNLVHNVPSQSMVLKGEENKRFIDASRLNTKRRAC